MLKLKEHSTLTPAKSESYIVGLPQPQDEHLSQTVTGRVGAC